MTLKSEQEMSNDEQVLVWDLLANGQLAWCKRLPDGWKQHGALVRGVALAKAEELALISAEFGGTPEVFDRRLRVTAEGAGTISSVAMFLPSYEPEGDCPSMALRRATWSREKDHALFQGAESKRRYLESATSIDSHIRFLGAVPVINQLWAETENVCRCGIALAGEPSGRFVELEWLAFEASFETFHFEFAFSPRETVAPGLEPLVHRWLEAINKLVDAAGVLPDDHSCQVSYDLSVWERLDWFAE